MDYDYITGDSEDESEPELSPPADQATQHGSAHSLRPPRTTTYSAESLYRDMTEGNIDLEPEYVTSSLETEIRFLTIPTSDTSAKLSGHSLNKSV